MVHPWSSHAPRAVDAAPAAIGRELGARHLLDGSVRRDGAALVVAVRLVEAESGRQLWAERLAAPATEPPAIQLDIATRVAGALAAESDRRRLAAARRAVDLDGEDHVTQLILGRILLYRREFAAPEPGEELRWLLHVSPFRRDEDRRRLEAEVRFAGIDDGGAGEAATTTAAATAFAPSARCAFRRDGETWAFTWEGRSLRLAALKGFADLAMLLTNPARAFHCLELAGRPEATDRGVEVLDAPARSALERRVRELQEEHDEAEARTAVTWRIRSAIRKLAGDLPRLGAHLERSVRTGTWCRYDPATPVRWEV